MGQIGKWNPIRIIATGFHLNGAPNGRLILGVLLIALAQALVVFIGSAIDGTLFLLDNGDGFLEHYGVWAILITDPLLIISVSFAYRKFFNSLNSIPINVKLDHTNKVEKTIFPYVEFLHFKRHSKYIYALLLAVGVLCWLNNIRQTVTPTVFYGNDVFDALQYRWGFLANKLNLFYSWVFVYPLVGFALITMSVSLRLILQKLVSDESVAPTVLHPDGCYGLSSLGTLNVALLAPYFLAFCVMFALLITHQSNYFSVVAPLLILSVIMVMVSFIIIGPVTKLGRKVHKQTYEKLVEDGKNYNSKNSKFKQKFEIERLCFAEVSATPYTKWSSSTINIFRIVPIVLTTLKFIL